MKMEAIKMMDLRGSLMVLVALSLMHWAWAVEEFSEDLLLRPLSDRKLLAHFLFTNTLSDPHAQHHNLFPKPIYQLVKKFGIREMELSFTQGRWNYERWGGSDPVSSQNAKPVGVELWALFDVSVEDVDSTWQKLTHALSGLFCASINFLESSSAYASPKWSFHPKVQDNDTLKHDSAFSTGSEKRRNISSSKLRYGALPREAVCTENLTPWLKLLPCRDKAGLAALMDRPSIYKGFYHSQRLHVSSDEKEDDPFEGIVLRQTLTAVLQPETFQDWNHVDDHGVPPSWSISSLFGRELTGQCLLAKSSNVFLELEKTLVEKLAMSRKYGGGDLPYAIHHRSFEVKGSPDRLVQEIKSLGNSNDGSLLFEFSVDKYNNSYPLDVGIAWKTPVAWSPLLAPFHISRYLMGSGNARGSIVVFLQAHASQMKGLDLKDPSPDCNTRMRIFQVVPWYVRLYYHTLQVSVDGVTRPLMEIVKKMEVSPAEDRKSPGAMELEIEVPCGSTTVAMVVDFDKGYLRIDEHPPDANQGFDLPSAFIMFPASESKKFYGEASHSKMLQGFMHKSTIRLYTEVLLMPLATPDFSMPYNVITLTCTVLALYFGSLFNVLRRRIGEEEQYLKRKGKMQDGKLRQILSKVISNKLYRVILVGLVAVAVHFYMNYWN